MRGERHGNRFDGHRNGGARGIAEFEAHADLKGDADDGDVIGARPANSSVNTPFTPGHAGLWRANGRFAHQVALVVDA